MYSPTMNRYTFQLLIAIIVAVSFVSARPVVRHIRSTHGMLNFLCSASFIYLQPALAMVLYGRLD